jgi:hypothetical protein
MSFSDNLALSSRIKSIIEASSDTLVSDYRNLTLFKEAAIELSLQINAFGVTGLKYEVLSNFLDKLDFLLKDSNKHQAEIRRDLTHPIRPTRWPSDE